MMLRTWARSRFAAAAILACAAAIGGCGKKMWISQYPSFHTPELKTIAVVDFRNESAYPRAGKIFAEQLAAALRANGTYQVLAGAELADALARGGEKESADADKLGANAAELGKVQAVLTGTVTEYRPRSGFERRQHYPYGGLGYYSYRGRHGYYGHWGLHGHYPWRSYWGGYDYAWNEAHVAVTAELIRVRDKAKLYSTGLPVGASVYSAGGPPRRDRCEVLAEATGVVVGKLIERIAVVRRQVKLDAGKALRTAGGRDGDRWRFTDDFRPGQDKMFVLLALPRAADRNAFRLTIVRKGSTEVLAERELVWSAGDAERAYRFSPKAIAGRGGQGDYRVRLHARDQVVMTRSFEIEP